MKTFTVSTAFGILLSLLVIYLLDGLNAGGVGIVVVVCAGIANGVGQLVKWFFGKRK